MLPSPLAPLAAYPQFVVWRLVDGKKLPYSPIHGGLASSTNPKDWGSYEQALAAATSGAGVGFVFTERDPFWFLDIDGAWSGTSWSSTALEICAALPGAAMEVSQSGTGLHLIGSGAPPADHANKNTPLHLELYTKERFVALTGTNAQGNAATDLTAPLAAIAARYFTRAAAGRADEWTTEPVAEWSGPADDNTLLERAMRSVPGGQTAANAFGEASRAGPAGVSFADLFTADADILGARWPSSTGQAYDASSADQAFANLLAFWTGKDCERIERIMRMSALARSKWDDHATYLQNTILNAVGTVGKVYVQVQREAAPPPPPPRAPADAAAPGGVVQHDGGYLLATHQEDYFAGCIYVQNLNKVLTPSGDLLDQARFNVVYGGYEFVTSPDGKSHTGSAWTAYTENQNFKPVIADRICFRPELGAGGIVRDAGKNLANTYQPVEHDDIEGDASKFTNHLRLLFPHGEDFDILISWMASVVQNPGRKAQWWPIVQGAEGNFKSFLLTIMAHAVGSHYAHLPNMEKMIRGGSNFNGWVERKLFLGLDEVYAANRRDFFEGFKTTVTNRSIPIEGKGVEEVTGDNRANGMIVTNHQDGVPLSGRNRRYAAFFAAQQTPEDMIRDGMNAAYITDLKDWLLGEGPYAAQGLNYGVRVVCGHLRTRTVEARLDPHRLSVRCPETTSTAAALQAGLGRIEQEVLEAIQEERTGFAGGWVSSTFLDHLMSTSKAGVPRNKRREMMQSLGYDYHPALPDGRVHSVVQPDNSRPRLYIKNGHISRNISNQTEAAKAYTKAQGPGAAQAAFGT